jgi:hypothetical protein
MVGKRLICGILVLATLGLTGCCRWCERHCCQPATCCQQPMPAYAPQPTAYQAPAAYAQPGCCQPTAQPVYSQWQRPMVMSNGCCE